MKSLFIAAFVAQLVGTEKFLRWLGPKSHNEQAAWLAGYVFCAVLWILLATYKEETR